MLSAKCQAEEEQLAAPMTKRISRCNRQTSCYPQTYSHQLKLPHPGRFSVSAGMSPLFRPCFGVSTAFSILSKAPSFVEMDQSLKPAR